MAWKKIEDFLPYVMPEVPGCPPNIATTYITLAVINFCAESWAWNVWTEKETFPAGESEIPLTYPTQSKPDGIMQARKNDENYSLHYLGLEDGVVQLDQELKQSADFQFKIALKPTQGATIIPEWIFEDYVETIAAGTKHKLMSMVGQPWANPNSAAYNYDVFRKGISQAGSQKRIKEKTRRSLSVQSRSFLNTF